MRLLRLLIFDRFMSFDLQKTLASKRDFRRDLASRPIAEKLRMLDVLRERELTIRGLPDGSASAATLREKPTPYRAKAK
jgi:hypothetical protein